MSDDRRELEAVGGDRAVMLELRDVSINFHAGRKTYDHGIHHVLDRVSLRLYEGETLGMIGRNGVGKTTMLRIMAGILAPSSGSISVAPGKSVSLLTLGLGFKPDLSGRDNALLAAMLQGSTRKQARTFLPQIREFSELGDAFELPVKTYSSGMRARLGFTTALMTHVDILLIDEVLSVGDAQFRGKAQTAMQERVTGEQTVVFVSHMADQVKAMCDRVILLEEGKVSLDGDPEEVVDAYQDRVNKARKTGAQEQDKHTQVEQRPPQTDEDKLHQPARRELQESDEER